MDVFDFAQCLRLIDDILVIAVVAVMFVYMAYPRLKRITCRVRVKANQRDKYYRGYRG